MGCPMTVYGTIPKEILLKIETRIYSSQPRWEENHEIKSYERTWRYSGVQWYAFSFAALAENLVL